MYFPVHLFFGLILVSIDKATLEVKPSDKLTFAPGQLEEIQDELPDNAPRYVLLSYEVESPFLW